MIDNVIKNGQVISMALTKIEIGNLGIFRHLQMTPSAGINVIIGGNGTGKTQLLKTIYARQKCALNNDGFGSYFKRGAWSLNILKNSTQEHLVIELTGEANPVVFIPVKDMLTHSKGLLAMAEKYRSFPFDKTLTDIIGLASQWTLKNPPELALSVLPVLERMLQGRVVVQNEEFYIEKSDGRLVNFAVEAEGLKKLGLLWQLLMNESITENTVLLWDEPEANLNPEFLPELVECLLELARHGVQIFVSTHNYIFAKYFDVRRRAQDDVCYHALYISDGATNCETKAHFDELEHNAIMQSFNQLLEEVYRLQVGE